MTPAEIEAEVIRLTGEGVSQEAIAEQLGITRNWVWAIRAHAGVPKPVSAKQLAIATRIVERHREAAAAPPVEVPAPPPARKRAARPAPPDPAKKRRAAAAGRSKARRSSGGTSKAAAR
jgi:transcriptional regulator with XRE-family HTH domain